MASAPSYGDQPTYPESRVLEHMHKSLANRDGYSIQHSYPISAYLRNKDTEPPTRTQNLSFKVDEVSA